MKIVTKSSSGNNTLNFKHFNKNSINKDKNNINKTKHY